MLFFVGLVLVVIVLIHVYLYKRLVRDPLPAGRARVAGQIVAALLGVLLPVTLIGVRNGHVTWLAWPGYLWLAVMFYLLVTLVVLEVPRLVVRTAWRVQGRRETVAALAKTTPATGGAELPDQNQAPGIDRRLLLARGAAIFAGLTAVGVTGYGMKTALGPPQLNRVQMPLTKTFFSPSFGMVADRFGVSWMIIVAQAS